MPPVAGCGRAQAADQLLVRIRPSLPWLRHREGHPHAPAVLHLGPRGYFPGKREGLPSSAGTLGVGGGFLTLSLRWRESALCFTSRGPVLLGGLVD